MFTGKQWIGVTSIGVISFSGGAALGHFLTKRKFNDELHRMMKSYYREQVGKINSIREEETGLVVEGELSPDAGEVRVIRDFRLHSVSLTTDPEAPGRVESVSDAIEAIKDFGEKLSEAVPPEVVEASIFPPATDDWDYEAELNTRENKEIYTIHRDEFFNDEMHFKQGCVTYYKGDDILVDELQKPIYNYPSLIGDVLDFGRGSGGDPNAFYVRNERERAEFEVILDEGLYAVEVMGLEVEDEYKEQDLKHSAVRRFVLE